MAAAARRDDDETTSFLDRYYPDTPVFLVLGAARFVTPLNFGAGPGPCYADCDTSSGVGVLDIFDFLCFQNAFALGCS